MIVRFLFCLFGSPTTVHLEFPAFASLPLCNVSHGSGHLSSHKLQQLFLKWFGISVTLCDDSSANSAVKLDINLYVPKLIFPIESGSPLGVISTVRYGAPEIRRCLLLSRGWLAQTLARDESWFSLISAKHASFTIWNHLVLWKFRLPPKMPPIFHQFWSAWPTFHFSDFLMVF